MKVLEVNNLIKKYKDKTVVDSLSFSVEEGDIVGLLGPNGAGKSTTINSILNLIKIDSGEIRVLGHNPKKDSKATLKNIGVATESPSFYDYLSGYDNLRLIANYYMGISDDDIRDLLGFVGLISENKKKVKQYSTGMKQRLGLARALLTNPKLILLDEPTNGLDPYGTKEIYELIEELSREKNITFVISSHLLSDIERLCNKVIILDKGKKIYDGDIKEIESLEKLFFKVTRGEDSVHFNKKRVL